MLHINQMQNSLTHYHNQLFSLTATIKYIVIQLWFFRHTICFNVVIQNKIDKLDSCYEICYCHKIQLDLPGCREA